VWSVGCILVELCTVCFWTLHFYFSTVAKCKWFCYNFASVEQGEALFQTHENLEHLAMMERVLGPMPQNMLKRVEWVIYHICNLIYNHMLLFQLLLNPSLCFLSRHTEKYVRRGRLDWPEGAASRESIKAVLKLPRLQVCIFFDIPMFLWDQLLLRILFLLCSILTISSAYVFFWQNLVMQHVDHSAGDLIHLLQGLLRYDPMDRLTAREALRHPFFAKDHRRIWGMDWLLIVCWNCCCKQRGHKSQDIWMCCSKLLTQSKSVQYGNLLRMINRMLICKQPV